MGYTNNSYDKARNFLRLTDRTSEEIYEIFRIADEIES